MYWVHSAATNFSVTTTIKNVSGPIGIAAPFQVIINKTQEHKGRYHFNHFTGYLYDSYH